MCARPVQGAWLFRTRHLILDWASGWGTHLLNKRKLLKKVLAGSKNIRFAEVVSLVEAFGFHLSRVSGSHHIFVHPDVPELLNLQEVSGQAKPYQIQQWLRLVERYNLRMED